MTRRCSTTLLGSLLAAAACVVAACDDDPETAVGGSGTIAVEEREVSGFSEVFVEGSGDVIVDLADRESMTIEADDNLLELISTEVRGSRLVIRHDEALDPTTDIVYRIEAIDFDGIAVAGSADVVAPGVDCETFSVAVAGFATIDVDGTCDALEVEIAGSGELDAGGLVVDRAEVSIAGSGDVIVNATGELQVSIAGSGDVVYLGDPATDIDIQGSGDVRRGS